MKRTLVLLLYCLLLTSCATVQLASSELDFAAKQFQPLSDQAQVYVVWTSPVGADALFQVAIDGRGYGGIAANTFLVIPVAPGPHTIQVFSTANQGVVQVHTEPGSQYFVQMRIKAGGLNTKVVVELLEEPAGRLAVKAAARAEGLGVLR